ncbi:MAG: hypothetical protein HYR96_00880 [Deltaproteobacteria bacterium]|nr:hypothetical protein [Deltaproteobacteria bacterium]MBI3296078.1 hypothetical protein [Deltaproteobacteria bacterium]
MAWLLLFPFPLSADVVVLDSEQKQFLVLFHAPSDDTVRIKSCKIVSKDASVKKRDCEGSEIASMKSKAFLSELYRSLLRIDPVDSPAQLVIQIEKLVEAIEQEEVADLNDANTQLHSLRKLLTIRIFLEKVRVSLAVNSQLFLNVREEDLIKDFLAFIKRKVKKQVEEQSNANGMEASLDLRKGTQTQIRKTSTLTPHIRYLHLNLPENAVVYVNDRRSTLVEPVRTIRSINPDNQTRSYTVRVEGVINGKTEVREETVVLDAGEDAYISFQF